MTRSAPWLTVALAEVGVTETPGTGTTARIAKYHTAAGYADSDDEVPWCSSFACWVMERLSIPSTNSRLARSWLKWGVECDARPGAVVVFERGTEPWQGHVAFVLAASGGVVHTVDGNVRDTVSINRHHVGRVLGYRWPEHVPALVGPAVPA